MFGGAAGDADAHAAIAKARPALARGSIDVNPLLFLDGDGAVVAEMSSGEATTAALLAKLEQVLADHPEFARPGPDEAALVDPVERAELCIDLRRDAEADQLLAAVDTPRAHYLRGRLARWRGDFAAMRQQFELAAKAPELAADIRIETAYEAWQQRDFDALTAQLADFPQDSPRLAETRYFAGLARFHAGEVREARALWRTAIGALPPGPWVYRMDWAWSECGPQPGAESLLGRIGYFGAYRNPDLARPAARR